MKTKILLSTLLIAGSVCSASAAVMRSPIKPTPCRAFVVGDAPLQKAATRDDLLKGYETEFNTVFIAPVVNGKLVEIRAKAEQELAERNFIGLLVAELQKTFPNIQIQDDEISPYVNAQRMAQDFTENVYKKNFELSVRESLFTESTTTSNAIVELMSITPNKEKQDKLLAVIRKGGVYTKEAEIKNEVNSIVGTYIGKYDPYQILVGAIAAALGNDETFRANVITPKLQKELEEAKLKKTEKALFGGLLDDDLQVVPVAHPAQPPAAKPVPEPVKPPVGGAPGGKADAKEEVLNKADADMDAILND